jgi:hypothetical protein
LLAHFPSCFNTQRHEKTIKKRLRHNIHVNI